MTRSLKTPGIIALIAVGAGAAVFFSTRQPAPGPTVNTHRVKAAEAYQTLAEQYPNDPNANAAAERAKLLKNP
jgi:hypothetical protein